MTASGEYASDSVVGEVAEAVADSTSRFGDAVKDCGIGAGPAGEVCTKPGTELTDGYNDNAFVRFRLANSFVGEIRLRPQPRRQPPARMPPALHCSFCPRRIGRDETHMIWPDAFDVSAPEMD
jgi:hypothetical protein